MGRKAASWATGWPPTGGTGQLDARSPPQL